MIFYSYRCPQGHQTLLESPKMQPQPATIECPLCHDPANREWLPTKVHYKAPGFTTNDARIERSEKVLSDD